MIKSVLKNTRSIRDWTFLILILTIATVTSINLHSEIETETPIEKSEKLILTGDYEDALFALKPLLISEEKNDAQEQALWIAHQLADKVRMKIDDEGSIWSLPNKTEEDKRRDEARHVRLDARYERVKQINELGNVLYYYDSGGYHFYDGFFLQQLIERYPNTSKRAFAEYHLLFSGLGFHRSRNLDTSLKQLHEYVEKYENTARIEVYKAYREIARIHHGTWAALMKPDYGAMPETLTINDEGDREKYNQQIAYHRAEALKYYALYNINPHGLPSVASYQRLLKNEVAGQDYIVRGC